MPLPVSSAYETKNAASARIPAYFVTFGDSDVKYSTHPEFLGGFDVGPGFTPGLFDVIPGPVPLEEGTMAFPYMAGISVSGGRVRPQEGSSSTGSLQVTLLDFGGAITQLLADNTIAPGRSMTLYTGFGDIGLQDFSVWMRGVIDDIEMPTPRVYRISAMERSAFQSQQVFHPAITKIGTVISAGRLAIDLDSTAFFKTPTVSAPTYVVIDDEVIKFEAFAEGTVKDEARLDDGRLVGNILNDPEFAAQQVIEGGNILADGSFATGTPWNPLQDFAITGSALVYTHSAGTGSCTQAPTALSNSFRRLKRYRFTYTLSGLSGTITSLQIDSPVSSAVDIPATAGTHSVEFVSSSAAHLSGFGIVATSSSGGFTLDDFSMIELQELGRWTIEETSVDLTRPFTFNGGRAIYSHVGSLEKSLIQTPENMLLALVAGTRYRFTYTLSDKSGSITSLEIRSTEAGQIDLSIDEGTHTYEFEASAPPNDKFILDIISVSGGFTLSGLTLVRLDDFTGILATERGALNSMAAEHADGAQVRELFRLTGHPLDIAVEVMTGVGNLGMEIDSALIDQASFDLIKAEFPGLEFEFLIGAQEEGKRWIEEQIFSPLGCFLVTTSSGTLALRSLTVGEATNTITDDHILEPPTWRGNFGEAINAMGISYDHQMAGDVFHPASADYGGRIIPEDGSLLETDRRQKEHHLRGVRSALVDAEEFLEDYAHAIFARYALGPTTVQLSAMLSKHVIEQGDFLPLTSRLLPNRITGALGLTTARALVLGRDLDFVTGRINFELQLTGVQHVTNGSFDSATGWTMIGDFAIAGGKAVYTHSTGGGQLGQLAASLAIPLINGRTYQLTYTVSGKAGDAQLQLVDVSDPSGSTPVNIPSTNGTHAVDYDVIAVLSGALVITVASASGGLSLDDISLVG